MCRYLAHSPAGIAEWHAYHFGNMECGLEKMHTDRQSLHQKVLCIPNVFDWHRCVGALSQTFTLSEAKRLRVYPDTVGSFSMFVPINQHASISELNDLVVMHVHLNICSNCEHASCSCHLLNDYKVLMNRLTSRRRSSAVISTPTITAGATMLCGSNIILQYHTQSITGLH
ncbi:repeat element 29 [Diadegma semiclausum ichnovirus]|nr:repeat element 2 [Diadegma semiclausum ichnovirus]AHY22028.1 repeat element 29 [Diadegma semiclausum ichnovirus]